MEIQNNTLYAEKLDEVYMRVFGDPSLEKELADFFTYEYPGARFTPQYKARLWDGKVRLYDQYRKTLYIGLYEYLEKFCERNGYMLQTKEEGILGGTVTEMEVIKEFTDWLNLRGRGQPIEVRDYQLEAIHTAINKERTLLLSPTASGKSLIIYSTMRWHLNNKRKCVLIVPTTSLVEQMYADFEDYSSANGFVVKDHCQKLYSGFPKEFTKDVLITTWQSIYLQPKSWFRQFDVIFGDEAHQFKAKSLTTVMEKLDTVKHRIGTTGTLDNKKIHQLVLEGIFGPVHRVTTTKALMDAGKLTSLNITCLILKYSDEIRKERNKNTYQDEMDWLVTNEKRNKFIRNLAVNSKGNTLVLFQYVEKHGKVLYDLIKSKVHDGRHVLFVHGGTEVADRESIRHITEKRQVGFIIQNICVAIFFINSF